ncbi:trigger factor [Bacteroidales bacterium 6E]|nr:trigger factor [Bacteroidales bacterium 6E]
MKINRENTNNGTAIIKVLVEKNDYEKNVADKLREYRQKASLPGFRPGKVPAGVIQKRFGKALLAEEVNQLLSQNLINYLRDEKINIIGDPLPNNELQQPIDFDKQEEFEFVFDIALTPDVNLTLDKSHSVDYYRIKVDEQLIDENIDQILNQYGTTQDVDVVSEESYMRVDFSELDAEGNVKEGGIVAENVLIAYDRVKDEEVQKQLIGKKPEESLVMDPVTAFGDRHEVGHMLNISHEVADELNSQFICTVKSIQNFVKGELNDELYKKLFGEETDVTTVEQFREKVAENISASLENSSKQQFEVDARKSLVAAVPMELPESFLKRWLKETNKELTDAKIEEDFEDFTEDLRWQLIKNNIINENKIEVSEEETLQMAKNIALSQFQQYGIYQVADEHLESYAHRIMEKEDDRERIVRRVFEIKVYDLVREKVQLNEKEVTTEEFKAL